MNVRCAASLALLVLSILLGLGGCAERSWKAESGPLLADFKNHESDHRYLAAGELAKIPDPDAIQPLIEALADDDPDYREMAAEALEHYLDAPGGFDYMAEYRATKTDEELRKTAKLFGQPYPPPGYAWKQYEADMRTQAAATAKALKGAFRAALSENKDPRKTALLFGAFRHSIPVDWNRIEAPLVGRAAVPSLVALTRDADPAVRAGAAVALGRIGDPAALEAMVALLKDPSPAVPYRVAEALADLGDKRAVPPLIAALKITPIPEGERGIRCGNQPDPEWEPAARAAWALGKLKAAEAFDALVAGLKEGDGSYRCCVAEALGRIGDPRAIGPLATLCRDPNTQNLMGSDPTDFAANALAGFGKPAIGPLMEMLKDEHARHDASAALRKIGEETIEPLVVALRDGDDDLRSMAALTLGGIKSPRVVPLLIELLSEKNEDVRHTVIWTLQSMGDRRATPTLLAIAQDTHADGQTRNDAVWAFRMMPDPRAIQPLTHILLRDCSKENECLLMNTAQVLATCLGEQKADVLLDCARNNKDLVRRQAAIAALGSVKDPRAVPALLAFTKDADKDIRSSAVGALRCAALNDTHVPQVMAVLTDIAANDPDADVRKSAAAAVEEIKKHIESEKPAPSPEPLPGEASAK